MVLARVIPATKLPLNTPQRYTYSVDDAAPGQLVSVPLGRRQVAGLIIELTEQAPAGVTLKRASKMAQTLPATYVSLVNKLSTLYHVPEGLILKLLLSGYRESDTSVAPAPLDQSSPPSLPTLSTEQARETKTLIRSLGHFNRYLLEGVTGSGKTEVYAHTIQQVLAEQKQALLLVPEIAIATHLVDRLQSYFGSSAVIWHSHLSPKKRQEQWARAMAGQPILLIGTRSALFVPLPKLGCIVMDEEHDGAYKQWDQEPRFHARVVAQLIAQMQNCPLILGSATPSLETAHSVRLGVTKLLRLTTRFGGSALPQIELVDRSGTPATEPLSPAAHNALSETLAKKRQAIILINRRGTAPLVLCEHCGHIWRCTLCARAMVWHSVPHAALRCHFCGSSEPVPQRCSECKKAMVSVRGQGSQRIETTIRSQYPDARVARLDADISGSAKKVRELTDNLTSGVVDVLVGTQLVAKGWDLEKVDLVIVLHADQGLLSPDFRAHERTVQLLWQVAGRAGRRKTQGRVLIETMQPEHAALQAVLNHDYSRFVTQELKERQRFGYPPFKHVVMYHRDSSDLAQADRLRAWVSSVRQLYGDPTVDALPAQLVTKPRGKQAISVSLLTAKPKIWIRRTPADWLVDLDPESLYA